MLMVNLKPFVEPELKIHRRYELEIANLEVGGLIRKK